MTELEKKDEILKLLTKALIIAIDDDVNLTLRGNRVYVDYGCSQFAIDIDSDFVEKYAIRKCKKLKNRSKQQGKGDLRLSLSFCL